MFATARSPRASSSSTTSTSAIPVAMARYYYEQGADELVFYDITASNERRGIMIEVSAPSPVKFSIPFSVGGGLRTLEDMRAVLLAGPKRSRSIRARCAIRKIIAAGRPRVRQPMHRPLDAGPKRRDRSAEFPSGYEVVIDGGRTPTGRDALLWAQEGERLGAGELCINSIDRDGTKLGYDLESTRAD